MIRGFELNGIVGGLALVLADLALQLQLQVQQQNLGVLEVLGLLLEARVGERLLEGDAADQLGVGHAAAGHLLDAHQAEIEVRVEHAHGLHDHGGEVLLVGADQLGVQRGAGHLLEHHTLLLGVRLGNGHRDGVERLERLLQTRADAADDHLRVHSLIDEFLGVLQDLCGQQHHGRRSVAHLGVLRLGDVHQGLGSGVDDVEELHDASAVV